MNRLVRLIAGTAMVLLACGLAVAEPLTLAIAKAAVVSDQASGQRALNLKMTPESAKAFADFTRANVGKVVDLSVDGAVVASPRLVDPNFAKTVVYWKSSCAPKSNCWMRRKRHTAAFGTGISRPANWNGLVRTNDSPAFRLAPLAARSRALQMSSIQMIALGSGNICKSLWSEARSNTPTNTGSYTRMAISVGCKGPDDSITTRTDGPFA